METRDLKRSYPFLQGGGEMGNLTRSFDWSKTSIGTPDTWPQSLCTTVSNLLRSYFPMFLWWGEDMIQFYNDAYRPSLGNNGKHPLALGQQGVACWPEIWPIIYPLIQQVKQTGAPTWMEDQLIPIYRNGKLEDAYWTFSYSSVLDDDGAHGGILVTCIETTETVKGRLQLQESETRFRNIIGQVPVAIALTRGEDFVFESITARMLQIIHQDDEQDVLGRRLTEVLPELVSQPVFNTLLNVLQTGESFHGTEVETELMHEGTLQRRYFNITYSRMAGKDGVPSVLHIASDVTDGVLARRKTEESEAKLRSILNSAPTAIGVFAGPDLIVENPNQLLIEVMAAGPDIEGKSFRKLIAGLVEGDQQFIGLVDAVRTTGVPFEGQEIAVFFKAANKTRYFNINFIPLYDESGAIYAVLDVSVDVTEQVLARKKVEEKETALEAALEQVRLSKEAAELGTFDMDLEKGTMHWDDRCRILFGISHSGPVTYEKDFVGGLHPDDRERITAIIQNCFIKSVSNGDYDVSYRTVGAEDGVQRWVRAKGKVYFNGADKPVRFVGSVLDITTQVDAFRKVESLVAQRTTELAQANENLLQTNKELQRSNKNLEEFAHAASHDLKEPIRKIQFFSQMLKEQLGTELNEASARALSRIENATQRMGALIDDLLLYSHVSHRPHQTETVDLNQKLQRVLEDLELDIDEKRAIIHAGPLPVVQGYKRQLQQLFQNLLSNALKYSKAGMAPKIDITASTVEESGRPYHLIKVADNGIGFEEEYSEKIFQMFSRLHGKGEYSGTGVGLSIVKKVVENHDGFIRVESKVSIGSVFKIYLPAQ